MIRTQWYVVPNRNHSVAYSNHITMFGIQVGLICTSQTHLYIPIYLGTMYEPRPSLIPRLLPCRKTGLAGEEPEYEATPSIMEVHEYSVKSTMYV